MSDPSARLRELATEYERGLLSLSDEEVLTFVLSSAGRPSKHMAQIAQQILGSCGLQGLTQELVNAPMGLTRFGLSTSQVNRLKMAYELITRCHLLERIKKTQIRCAEDILQLVRSELVHLDHEELHVLVLDRKNHVVEYNKLYKGTVNSSVVRISEVFRPAVVRNCSSLIVCHNHPSGDPTPSPEDEEITRQLRSAGELLEIELLDHIIIGNPGFVSLKEKMRW